MNKANSDSASANISSWVCLAIVLINRYKAAYTSNICKAMHDVCIDFSEMQCDVCFANNVYIRHVMYKCIWMYISVLQDANYKLHLVSKSNENNNSKNINLQNICTYFKVSCYNLFCASEFDKYYVTVRMNALL